MPPPPELPDLETVQIPTLPEVVMKLSSMVENPLVGLREIGLTVREDASMAARLLRIANSASTGLREPVLSVEQAAAALGARAVRNLAMQAAVMDLFADLPQTPDLDLQLVWKHAILTAQICQVLAGECRHALPLGPDEYYSCGLVHDMGKLVLLQALGQSYLDVLHRAREQGKAAHVAEQEELGFNHVDVGARVSVHWGLPQVLVEAIQYHHGPVERIKNDKNVALVAVADQIAYRVQAGMPDSAMISLAPRAKELLGIEPETFAKVVRYAAEVWPQIQL